MSDFEMAVCPECKKELPALILIWSSKAGKKVCRLCWAKVEGVPLDKAPSVFGDAPEREPNHCACGARLDNAGLCPECGLDPDVCECDDVEEGEEE